MFLDDIRNYLERIKKRNGNYREYKCDPSKLLEGLSILVGPGAGESIILKEDTSIELGSPQTASCAFIVLINFPHLMDDGKITLIGPDIPESAGQTLDFGQVLLIGGAHFTDEHYKSLERAQFIGDQIEGFMIRTVPQKLWCRISKEVFQKGITFESIGRAYMHIFKSKFPLIEKMETIFVTSNKEDVQDLEQIAKRVRDKYSRLFQKEMKKKLDKIRSDCDNEWECDVCPERPVCDEIEDMVKMRKKYDE